jgi:predicted phosphodiesterase
LARILIAGDTHLPFVRKGYLQFLKDLRKKYRCNMILHIGDVVDSHSISFHEHHPELPNSLDEYKQAFEMVKEWKVVFPKMLVVIGNHDSRIIRLANSVNIPSQMLKTYQEIWETPGWNWQWSFDIDNIHYVHGHNSGGGLWPAYNMMRKTAQSCVCGHYHSAAGLKYLVNHNARLFGLDVGAGCDDNQLAFAYNQFNAIRSVMSAAVILDGVPYLEIMPISTGEKYYDKKEKT